MERMVKLGTTTYHYTSLAYGIGDDEALEFWSSYPPARDNLVMVFTFSHSARSRITMSIAGDHEVDLEDVGAAIEFVKQWLGRNLSDTIVDM